MGAVLAGEYFADDFAGVFECVFLTAGDAVDAVSRHVVPGTVLDFGSFLFFGGSGRGGSRPRVGAVASVA